MRQYFMGQELIQPELPANSPKPAQTPEEGVIMTDVTAAGTRRYIYRAMAGMEPEEIVISETIAEPATTPSFAEQPAMGSPEEVTPEVPEGVVLPEGAILPEGAVFSGAPSASRRPAAMAGREAPAHTAVLPRPASVQSVPLHQPAARPAAIQIQAAPAPMPGAPVSVPYPAAREQERPPQVAMRLSNSVETLKPVSAQPVGEVARGIAPPVQDRVSPMLGQISRPLPLRQGDGHTPDSYPVHNEIAPAQNLQASVGPVGGPSAFIQNQVPIRGLGQAAPMAPIPAGPPAPTLPKCPGAVEMPDGRVIEPGHGITLEDLCELVPFLFETFTGRKPGEPIHVTPGRPGMPIPTQGGMGPGGGAGPFGSAGGGFVGSGGGGPGPAGARGATGPAGPPGPGSITEPPVVKTDGDFVAGPGAFVPVPGTAVSFTMATAGVAEVKAVICLGSGGSQLCESAQLGVRIDGTDYPLTVRLIHTLVGGVGEFHIGQSFNFPVVLTAGPHTAEILLRGLLPGEFGGGLGIPAAVNANPEIPLIVTVSHS